jgi:tetratricopeptide (TPR) repeat protein
LNELLRYLSQAQIDPDTIKSSWEKVERIKGYLNQGSYLIILDGLEQMQKSEDGFGEMIHPELRELLYYLADASTIGLCLITTRYPLKDLERWRRSSLRELPLVELSIPDALSMLKKRGVKGSDDEMIEVIKRYKAHALSLTSMAGFLNRYYEGDIKRAPDIEFVLSDEERFKDVNKLLRRYAEKMKEAELCFLHIFSLFRKEITEREFSGVFLHNMGFNEVLVKMDELDFKDLVDGLVDWRLISYDEKEKTYTTHPLIKGYFEQSFAEEDKRECHKRIYHYFGEIAKDEPKTLEEMKPLFEQVYHGCMAGLYDEVFDGVYWEKINRKEENFIIHSLGAWGTALSLIRNFFPKGDLTKMPRVSKKKDQSFLLNSAGLALLNIGRPKEAEEPFLTGVRMDIEEKDWENASAGYQNLADLQFRIGELEKALNSAEEALKMAEKARSDEDIMTSKAYLGQILYLLGKSKEAEENFERADELEKKISGYQLYSGGGVWYADFLILENKIDEASDLTQQNLKICQSENWPADISRCHRVLSAICRKKKEYRKAEEHIRTSIEIAKKIGVSDLEIEALIESAKLYLEKKEYKSAIERADKIIRLCERTGFKLYEPDAELILSKAYLKENPQRSKHYAESAYKKAKDMGYHLPKAEAEQLLDKILSID